MGWASRGSPTQGMTHSLNAAPSTGTHTIKRLRPAPLAR